MSSLSHTIPPPATPLTDANGQINRVWWRYLSAQPQQSQVAAQSAALTAATAQITALQQQLAQANKQLANLQTQSDTNALNTQVLSQAQANGVPVGTGLAAGLPATANVSSGALAFYYATDTDQLFAWTGTAWATVGSVPQLIFNQAIPASVWTINHNQNRYPNVTLVVTSSGDVVDGDIDYTSANQIILSFGAPFSGTAYIG